MRGRGRARARRLVEAGEQMTLPCRYCGAECQMAKHLIEQLQAMSVRVLERRGEQPIRRDEIAVCQACRPRYEQEFCPPTTEVVVPRANVDGAFSPQDDDSPDGFGPRDEQQAMGF